MPRKKRKKSALRVLASFADQGWSFLTERDLVLQFVDELDKSEELEKFLIERAAPLDAVCPSADPPGPHEYEAEESYEGALQNEQTCVHCGEPPPDPTRDKPKRRRT